MIENVIKYVKHNFAKNRVYKDVDSFNQACMAWLKRTGNKRKHDTIKKVPAEVFSLEKEYLIPVPDYNFTVANTDSISYQVRKDNIVLYKGNRYRVPKGTYAAGKKVYMVVDDGIIRITDTQTGEIHATHPLSHEKGKLIGQKRNERDKSQSLQEQEELVLQKFNNSPQATYFLSRIHQDKPRYYRDQLGVIRKLLDDWNIEILKEGLEYCTEKELFSAGDFKSSVIYLNQLQEETSPKESLLLIPSKYCGHKPEIRDLSIYEQAMGGNG